MGQGLGDVPFDRAHAHREARGDHLVRHTVEAMEEKGVATTGLELGQRLTQAGELPRAFDKGFWLWCG